MCMKNPEMDAFRTTLRRDSSMKQHGMSTLTGTRVVRNTNGISTAFKVEYDENGRPKVSFSATGRLPGGASFSYSGGNGERSHVNVKNPNLKPRPPREQPTYGTRLTKPAEPAQRLTAFERRQKLEEIKVLKEFAQVAREPMEVRRRLVKTTMLQWHPDKHPDDVEFATRMFHFIASRKKVLLEESTAFDENY